MGEMTDNPENKPDNGEGYIFAARQWGKRDRQNMTTDRIANREPEVQYLKMGQDGETVMIYNEVKELPHDDLIDAIYAAIDYSSVEDRMAAYWWGLGERRIPNVNPSEVFTLAYGKALPGKRGNSNHKAVAKRRARNKAARKARRK